MLHTIHKSPYSSTALVSCLRLASPESAILLLEDGVYAAVAGSTFAVTILANMEKYQFYAILPDVLARGIRDKLIPEINLIDYDGFVDLVVEQGTVQNWL